MTSPQGKDSRKRGGQTQGGLRRGLQLSTPGLSAWLSNDGAGVGAARNGHARAPTKNLPTILPSKCATQRLNQSGNPRLHNCFSPVRGR
jgi:hypothetical protein